MPTIEPAGNLDCFLHHPLVDLKTQALVYYLHFHLQTPTDAPNLSKCVSDQFLSIWIPKAEYPLLDLSVSSMALAVFSRTQKHPAAALEASKEYHRLLQITQATIYSLDAKTIDPCLLAIFFMGRYEDVLYRPSHPHKKTTLAATFQSFSHHDGALAILKAWKDKLSHIQRATDVIKHSRRGLIRSAILRNLALPKWMLEGSSFGEYGLELEYDCILLRIINVRQRLFALLEEKTGTSCTSYELASTAEGLNREAQDIDTALRDWAASFPATWRHQRYPLSDGHPWPTKFLYSYSNPAYAAVWNQHYAARMLINSTRLRILENSCPDPVDFIHGQRLECHSRMKIMADGLIASIPFCLQELQVTDNLISPCHQSSIMLSPNKDVRPYIAALIAWPLSIASSLGNLDIKQKMWFRSQLARVGKILGVGVFECAEAGQWIVL